MSSPHPSKMTFSDKHTEMEELGWFAYLVGYKMDRKSGELLSRRLHTLYKSMSPEEQELASAISPASRRKLRKA